jgi:uncharacterized damage-inducible protein DinB
MKTYLGRAFAGLSMVSMLTVPMFTVAMFAADQGPQSKFQQEFLKHWSTAKDLTIAVADAMPADGYSFKPNPEEMTFGEQIVHIANANYNYCTRLTDAKSPFQKPATIDKASAMKVLADSFDYCTEVIQGAKDLDGTGKPDGTGKQMSGREVMLGAYAHMAHHRGQAEVYLRVKGIKPPQYKF